MIGVWARWSNGGPKTGIVHGLGYTTHISIDWLDILPGNCVVLLVIGRCIRHVEHLRSMTSVRPNLSWFTTS